MTPRRGFLQGVAAAFLAVALDVLPALGHGPQDTGAPPAAEHYLEWNGNGLWICSETVTAIQSLGDRIPNPDRSPIRADPRFFILLGFLIAWASFAVYVLKNLERRGLGRGWLFCAYAALMAVGCLVAVFVFHNGLLPEPPPAPTP